MEFLFALLVFVGYVGWKLLHLPESASAPPAVAAATETPKPVWFTKAT